METVRITLSSSEKNFTSLNEIFDSDRVHAGDTITLWTDVTIGATVTIATNKRCTIDLNGHFIFIPIPSGILAKSAAKVTFINGKIQTMSTEPIEDAIIVQGSKTEVTLGPDLDVNTHGTAVHVRKRGSLIIDGAVITATGPQPTIYVDDAYSILTMNSGSVASYEKSAIVVRSEGSVLVKDGEIHTESNGLVPETTYPAIIVNGKDSTFQMIGGSVHSVKTPAAQIQAAGLLTVTGGKLYTTSKDYPAVDITEGCSALKIDGGWVYATKTNAVMTREMEYGDVQSITMTDGKLGAVGDIFHIAGPGDHGILISGGAVKGNLPQDFIAPGYVESAIKDEDGYAPIILKTWSAPTDVSPIFPNASADPDVGDNPFDPVFDPDATEILPFPPKPIAGDYNNDEGSSNVILSTLEMPSPYPPLEEKPKGPFDPSDVLLVPEIPMPIPEDFDTDTEPDVEPAPEPVSDDKIPCNTSVFIKRKIYIYKTPSRKHTISEWRGALTILSCGYMNAADEEYAMVKFRIPGSGSTSTGYAVVQEIARAIK